MCKTCPVMPWVRGPVRKVSVGNASPSVQLLGWTGFPIQLSMGFRRSFGATLIPSKQNLNVSALLSQTCFAIFFLHWTTRVGQFSCCERALKNTDHCCSSSSSSPSACPYEDGATVKPISGSPELLFTSMWRMNWKVKDFFISVIRNTKRE